MCVNSASVLLCCVMALGLESFTKNISRAGERTSIGDGDRCFLQTFKENWRC